MSAAAGCSRRHWLRAAAGVAALALQRVQAAAVVQQREVQGFHGLRWLAAGELTIEQTGREALRIEAEPQVLARIRTEVRQGWLEIGFEPGRVESRQPIRFRLELRTLDALEADGAGTLRIGALATPALSLQLRGSDQVRIAALSARSLQARLDGAGGLDIDGGAVERQHVVIGGAADYLAARLSARRTEIAIDGSGQARVAAAERLVARIAGSGEVRYRGMPQVVQDISGAGSVQRSDD